MLLTGIRSIFFLVFIIFIFQQIIIRSALILFNVKGNISKFELGILFGRGFYWLHAVVKTFDIKVRKVIFLNLLSKIEFRDVKIIDNSKGNSEQKMGSLEELELSVAFKPTLWKILHKFLPVEIRLVNVSYVSPKQTLTAELVLLKLEYSSEKHTLRFVSFLHSIKVGKDLKLSQLEYTCHASCTYENDAITLNSWSSGLNVGGLVFSKSTAVSETDEKIGQESNIKRYRKIVESLKILTIQFENTKLQFSNGQSLFVSNAALHFMPFENIPGKNQSLKQNLTLAVNTLVFCFDEDLEFRIPVINILLTTDVLSLLSNNFSLQSLFGTCTVNVIDPVVTTSIDYICEKLSSQSKTDKSMDTFAFDLNFIPALQFKFIFSNVSLILNENNDCYYLLTSEQLNASIFHCQPGTLSQSALITENLSNSLRLENFVVTYNLISNDNTQKYILSDFEKWNFDFEGIFSSTPKVSSILHSLHFNLEELVVLDGVIECYRKLQNTKSSKASHDLPAYLSNSHILPFEFNVVIKHFTVKLCANNFLPSGVDTVKDDNIDLTKCSYYMHLSVTDSSIFITENNQRMHVSSMKLSKTSSKPGLAYSNDILTLADITTDFTDEKAMIKIPQLKFEFDINLIWFWFFFKQSIFNRFLQLSDLSKQVSNPSKMTSKTFEVYIENFLSVINLPDDMKLLLLMDDIRFSSIDKTVNCQYLNLLVNSVYTEGRKVYVPLVKIKELSFSHNISSGFSFTAPSITLKTEYHFRFYKIVDKVATTIKAYKQLRVAFNKLPSFEQIHPKADGPLRAVPINIKSDELILNVNEDLFEQELGLIYKVGVLEQRERLEKLSILQNSPKLGGNAASVAEKYYKLDQNFSTSWVSRYRFAKRKFHGATAYIISNGILGYNYETFSSDNDVSALRMSIKELNLQLNPPSFPLNNYPQFLYEHGKGIPTNTEYSTLVPLNIKLSTGIFSFLVRDYPLPALYFPNTNISGDIIFAEALASVTARRSIFVPFSTLITPKYENQDSLFGSHIIRTLTPIKTFMNLKCSINSSTPTQITWGKSLQPGYQNVMLWFDFLTKPPIDPSPKVGFWDKFRLLVHGTFEFHWEEHSPVHLNIKGSNDPYSIADIGAGLTFTWSGGAKLIINGDNSPDSFLQINSNKFQMGIRDFSTTNVFDKIIMKLNGEVKWKMGMLFEGGEYKSAGLEPRTKYLRPHYEVELVHPKFITDVNTHDSYEGFRSDFIHMSFGVYSDDDTLANNSVHIAPEVLSHFFAWWRLFNTYTSGPIRQGPLFSNILQNGKKFGKSLFTVKYQLSLAPLKITHVHRHADSQMDVKKKNNIAFTGIKAALGSLKLDLHQKRIKVLSQNDILQISRPIWKFSMNLAELDFIDADIRILFAIFDQEAVEELLAQTLGISSENDNEWEPFSDNNSEITDSAWFDKEDYIDLHQIQLHSHIPMKFSALPFIHSPRITYFRNITDQGLTLSYPFGDENVHFCYLGNTHSEVTQKKLTEERAHQLNEQILNIQLSIESLQALSIESGNHEEHYKKKIESLNNSLHHLKHSLHLIHEVLKDLEISDNASMQDPNTDVESSIADSEYKKKYQPRNSMELFRMNTIDSFMKMKRFANVNNDSSFDNRFIFHNVFIKINKAIRDHLMNYTNSIASRRQYQFFMTHKAMILLDELLKNRFQKTFIMEPKLNPNSETCMSSNKELLDTFQEFMREVMDGFSALDNYSIRLISPQVQITSESEKAKAILIVSRDIELSIIDVHSKNIHEKGESLGVNTLMETRYCFNFSDSQFFILDKLETAEWYQKAAYSNTYGVNSSDSSWPPWLPLEVSYSSDFLTESLFLKRNDMFITFTKPNSLFFNDAKNVIQYNESRFNIGFPKLYLTSNSEQYSAIFNILEDLLSFVSDKDKKIDKLTQVFLADEIKFNLGKLDSKVVESLQRKIRALKYLDSYTRFHDPQTYSRCSQDILVEFQTTKLELNLLMSAIKQNYERLQFKSRYKKNTRLSWRISADELIWELYDEAKNSFVVFGLGSSQFVRSESYYGSTSNKVSISTLQCYNLQETFVYKELLGPYEDHPKFDATKPFIEVSWNMGAPIGGISNLLELDFNSQPIIFKMDHKTSEKLMAYLFPKIKTPPADSNSSAVRQSINISDDSSHALIRKASVLSDSTNTSIPSPVTRRMMLGDWDVQSLTKALERTNSKSSKNQVHEPDLEMNEMVSRSSKYFNIGKITINGLIMSVSYKGSRSVITNVDNLIVKVPVIRYTNKLWSTEEFIASLRKDIRKVVLQHAGNIIGNKFVPHKNETKYEPLKQISNLLKPDLQRIQKSTASLSTLPTLSKFSTRLQNRSSELESNEDVAVNTSPDEYDVEHFYPEEMSQ